MKHTTLTWVAPQNIAMEFLYMKISETSILHVIFNHLHLTKVSCDRCLIKWHKLVGTIAWLPPLISLDGRCTLFDLLQIIIVSLFQNVYTNKVFLSHFTFYIVCQWFHVMKDCHTNAALPDVLYMKCPESLCHAHISDVIGIDICRYWKVSIPIK